jgi:transcriptional regulator with XRE-family HTH domain
MKTIRELRTEARMTQKELADRLGVTAPAVYNWERRTYEPRGSQIREMARIFGVSMDDISFEAINKIGRHPE